MLAGGQLGRLPFFPRLGSSEWGKLKERVSRRCAGLQRPGAEPCEAMPSYSPPVWDPPENRPGAASPALIGVSLLNWGVASLYSS